MYDALFDSLYGGETFRLKDDVENQFIELTGRFYVSHIIVWGEDMIGSEIVMGLNGDEISRVRIEDTKQFYVFETQPLKEIELPFRQDTIRLHPMPNEFVFAPYPPNNKISQYIYAPETSSLQNPGDIVRRHNSLKVETSTDSDTARTISEYWELMNFLELNRNRSYKVSVVQQTKDGLTKSDAKCYDYESPLGRNACLFYDKLKKAKQMSFDGKVVRFGTLTMQIDYHNGIAIVCRPDCVAKLHHQPEQTNTPTLLFSNHIVDTLRSDEYDCGEGKECDDPFLVQLSFD